MIPIPPNCNINIRIMIPGMLKVSGVDTTANPVTLIALTAVKTTSIKDHSTPGFKAIGKLSKAIDITTAIK